MVLTREDNETGISNSERAQLANESGANVMIRIHANGAESSSASGAMALIGSADNKYVGDLYDESNRLASDVLNAYCASTGMKNGEVQTSDTMTGINWSKIPVMILEMGFMTNETDDRNMENSDYQDRMVKGIVDGLNVYFGVSNSNNDDITDEILEYIASKGQNNGTISVYAKRLGSENGTASVVNEKKMQAASLIKLFIAGCVYENIDDVLNQESYSGETRQLLVNMITVSDNDAANELVRKLGHGDNESGKQAVNYFCSEHGYSSSSMGRMLLESNSNSDNYTSVSDCGAFLSDVYNGTLSGSAKIIELLKAQTRRSKIPAGIPSGVVVANKTGELSDVENDAAIIYAPQGAYVEVVMSEDLTDTVNEVTLISGLSEVIYKYYGM